MSPSPDDPTPPIGGARLRAKARVQPRVRAEVEDALGGLERSLVDVATWERMQASPLPPPPPPQPEGAVLPPPIPVSDSEAGVEEPDSADDEDGESSPEELSAEDGAHEEGGDEVVIPIAPGVAADMRVDLDPAVVPHRDAVAPLLTRFTPDALLDQLEAAADGSVLAGATGVAPTLTQADEEVEEARRRHRNGRILSWAGVLLLVGVAALWLIPDRSGSDDGKLPAVSDESTTTEDTLLLNPADLTTTTEATTTTAEVEVTAPTTTVKKSTSGSSKTTTTTKAPTTTTTARQGQPPLVTPGSPTRTVPPATTTTAPTTTTTAPTTTTSAAALEVGDLPSTG